MKTTLLCVVTLFALSLRPTYAQLGTATNIVAYDCSGTLHNLFNELDSGKVVILNWVMPCWGCIGPTQTSYDVAQSFSSSHPGKVLYYLLDDYGNTSCATLGNWVSSNIIGNKMKRFSDSTIHWSDFGAYSMPKIVVVGSDHQIYYNDLGAGTAAQQDIQAAVNAALGISSVESLDRAFDFAVVQTGTNAISVQVESSVPTNTTVEVFNVWGMLVALTTANQSDLHRMEVHMRNANSGIYFIRLNTFGGSYTQKFLFNR